MFIPYEGRRLLLALLIMAVLLSGCAVKTLEPQILQSQDLRPPEPQVRLLQANLTDFGKMIRAYIADERDIVIDIDLISNDGLQKGLPTDLGQYVRQVLDEIGLPIRTTRTLPPIVTLQSGPNAVPFLPRNPLKPPASYRLVGGLLYSSEIVSKGRNGRADAAGNDDVKLDAQIAGDDLWSGTNMKVGLTLERADGMSVPGGSAMYQIIVERRDTNVSLSLYVAGSGVGVGKKVTVTQNSGDALYDATAASIMHLLGQALQIPYYRSATNIFTADEALDNRVQDSLRRLTQTELEEQIKRFMYVQGFAMDLRGPTLTDADRAVVALEMQRRSLDFANRNPPVELAFRLWKDLDYRAGSERVNGRMAETARAKREQLVVSAAQRPAATSPTAFGWPASARMVLLDLSRLPNGKMREQIVATTVRSCRGCDEIKANSDKTVIGIRLSSTPSEVQRVLRQSPMRLRFVWTDNLHQRLVILPL